MNDEWEEVPTEDLWEDGEINNQKELMDKIEHHLLITGKWKLVRRRKWDPNHIKKKYKQTPTVL